MQGYSSTGVSRELLSLRGFAVMLFFATSLLSGCGVLQKVGILSPPVDSAPASKAVPVPLSAQPYTLNLSLSGSSDLNPDTQSRPSPVQVRVFIADAQSELTNKSFEEMFDYAGNAIDPRPLAMLTLRPGQLETLELSANKSQTLLVIAAAYRDPYQTQWKAAATLLPEDTVSASATISANAVTISPSP